MTSSADATLVVIYLHEGFVLIGSQNSLPLLWLLGSLEPHRARWGPCVRNTKECVYWPSFSRPKESLAAISLVQFLLQCLPSVWYCWLFIADDSLWPYLVIIPVTGPLWVLITGQVVPFLQHRSTTVKRNKGILNSNSQYQLLFFPNTWSLWTSKV